MPFDPTLQVSRKIQSAFSFPLKLLKQVYNVEPFFYSHLHINVPTRFLTCVPDLQSVPDPGYVDEADLFYADHVSWLAKNFPEVSVLVFVLFCL